MISSTSQATQAPSFYTVLCSPFRWIAEKIKKLAEVVFGYCIRIITFQMGVMDDKFARSVMRAYSYFFDPPRIKPFDAKRLEESEQLLVRYGGKIQSIVPKDGQSEITMMTFRSEDFFKEFARQGSHPINISYNGKSRRALLSPPKEAFDKFYYKKLKIQMKDGTIRIGALLPESPLTNNKPHIFHTASLGRSKGMDRRILALHLGAGYDITVWDPSGVGNSKGKASEGRYKLDAEAVFERLLEENIAPINRIYLSGYCVGAAIASHLKKKYHNQGVHLIAENPYTSMEDVVKNHAGFIGPIAAKYGMKAIQDPKLDHLVEQNNFSVLKNLSNLTRSTGKCIFIHTDTDKMMPRGTVKKLSEAFWRSGPIHEILRCHPDPKKNGHMQPPYEDPAVWRRYVEVVT